VLAQLWFFAHGARGRDLWHVDPLSSGRLD
jgi:hypothetical protein